MKTKFIFSLVLIFSFISLESSGQSFLEKMAKKAKAKAEKKAEQQVEKEIDKSIDKTFNTLEKRTKKDSRHSNNEEKDLGNPGNEPSTNKALNDLMKSLGTGSGTPVPLENKYDFNSSVTMNFKTYDSSGNIESNGDMVSYFSSKDKYIAYEFIDGTVKNATEKQNGTFILDFKNKATIILENKNGNKTGIAYGMGDMLSEEEWQKEMDENSQLEKEEEESPSPLVKKTGKKKKILGYMCEEYLFEKDDVTASYWITHDVSWNNKDLMSNLFSRSVYSYETPEGFLMMSTAVDKKTGEKTVYQVIDINDKDHKVFDLSQYQITNLGTINGQQMEDIEDQ